MIVDDEEYDECSDKAWADLTMGYADGRQQKKASPFSAQGHRSRSMKLI